MFKRILPAAILALFIASCQDDPGSSAWISPEAGSSVKNDQKINLEVNPARPPDSIVYLVDGQRITSSKEKVSLDPARWMLGNRLITAKVYTGTQVEEINTNVIILPAKAPEELKFRIVNTFPHDTSSYTQGLEFHDGVFYESDGEYAESSLRKVQLANGKALLKTDIPADYFAEGMTVVGDKIIMITYREKMGFVYDKNTLKKLSEFPYQVGQEGWGLVYDGKNLISTDGTNQLFVLNKDTYQQERVIEVYDNNGPVQNLNELEFIDGKIYANIYTSNRIVVIDPATGQVVQSIDLSGLYPGKPANPELVLNGIAYDKAGKRLFVTGKKWDKLFQIELYK